MKGYLINIGSARRDLVSESIAEHRQFAEAVPEFKGSPHAPIVTMISLEAGVVTHVGTGNRGMRAGTGQRRLNLLGVEALSEGVPHDAIAQRLGGRIGARALRYLNRGGVVPAKTFAAITEAVGQLAPASQPLLSRLTGADRRARVAGIPPGRLRAFAFQKEALGAALTCAGISREALRQWSPPSDSGGSSFLDGLPQARLREDAMLAADLMRVPGFDFIRPLPFAAAVFEGEGVRLTVAVTNRLPLEQQLGVDLIYYNETYKTFVMVQYKAMEHSADGDYFALPDQQLADEIRRMDAALATLRRLTSSASKEDFRLHANPFFLKLCPRMALHPDATDLVKGMYFPLDYWRLIEVDRTLVGPRGGRQITFQNVGRYMDNTEFVALLKKAWIGTNHEQSRLLREVIREITVSGRTMVLAVRAETDVPSEPLSLL